MSFYKSPDHISLSLRVIRFTIKVLSKIWPSLAARLLLSLFKKPRVNRENIRSKYNELGIFNQGDEAMMNIQGVSLFTYCEGTPKVLLVTGWESSARRFQTLIQQLQEEGIGFLYFDLPAQGLSEGTDNNAILTSKIIADLLQQFPTIDTIIGHSFGGASAFLTLSQYPDSADQITKLIMVGSPTRYQSVVQPFFTFLDVPSNLKSRFIRTLSEYVQNDFSKFDLQTMARLDNVDVHLFHDLSDRTIPASDAMRLTDRYQTHISDRQLGHRKIMHDPQILREFLDLLSVKMTSS